MPKIIILFIDLALQKDVYPKPADLILSRNNLTDNSFIDDDYSIEKKSISSFQCNADAQGEPETANFFLTHFDIQILSSAPKLPASTYLRKSEITTFFFRNDCQ